jgi:hypothetical protein
MKLLRKDLHFIGEQVTGMLTKFSKHSKFARNIIYINLLLLKVNTIWLTENKFKINIVVFLKLIIMD